MEVPGVFRILLPDAPLTFDTKPSTTHVVYRLDPRWTRFRVKGLIGLGFTLFPKVDVSKQWRYVEIRFEPGSRPQRFPELCRGCQAPD